MKTLKKLIGSLFNRYSIFSERASGRSAKLMSWMLVVLIPLSIVWIFTTYIAQPLIVSGDSMYPEIKDGDMIVMKKTNGNVYSFHEQKARLKSL